MQLRHATQLHGLAQQHAQVAGGIVEDLQVQRQLLVVEVAHQGDEHLGMADVTTDIHGGDGDETQARVLHFTGDQQGQLALHLVADALGTAIFFGHHSLLAKSQKLETPAGAAHKGGSG